MNSKLFSIVFLLFTFSGFSQSLNDKKIYLDSLSNETIEGNHKYYKIIKDYYNNQKEYKISIYYKNDKLKKEMMLNGKDGGLPIGEEINYYENGGKKNVINYFNGRPTGITSCWYENGNKKLDGEYIEDKKSFSAELKINQFWNIENIQTVVDGNGNYEEMEENSFASGKVKNGFKDGAWKGYDKKLDYTFTENYENQKFISGISIDSKKASHHYKVVNLKPEPRNGIMDFYKFVMKNFQLSNNVPKGKEGKVLIRFVIDEEGKIVEPEIVKSIGYGAEEEAIRMLLSFPENWNSGQIRGINVRCSFTLPIVIQSSY